MRRKRHTPEQIIRKLREADAQLGAGATVADVSRKLGVSENALHRWRAQYGGMKLTRIGGWTSPRQHGPRSLSRRRYAALYRGDDMTVQICVPDCVDGGPVSPALRIHLQRVADELDRDPADWSKLKAGLTDLLLFLKTPVGRTHANCDATDSVFTFQLSEHPVAADLPNDLAEIFFDIV